MDLSRRSSRLHSEIDEGSKHVSLHGPCMFERPICIFINSIIWNQFRSPIMNELIEEYGNGHI